MIGSVIIVSIVLVFLYKIITSFLTSYSLPLVYPMNDKDKIEASKSHWVVSGKPFIRGQMYLVPVKQKYRHNRRACLGIPIDQVTESELSLFELNREIRVEIESDGSLNLGVILD